MASLRLVIAELRQAGSGEIPVELRAEMAKAARPFAPLVRAAIMNIPVKGEVPYHQPPGLRARIAACVESWAEIHGPEVSVGVEVNASRMPNGQKALPLYMDGDKAPWWHPVFGNRDPGVIQEAHPYFWDTVQPMLPATARAIERAVQKIADTIHG